MGVDLQGVLPSITWNYMVKLKDVNGNLTSATQTIAARKGTGDVSVLRFRKSMHRLMVGTVMLHHWKRWFPSNAAHAVPVPAGFPI